MIPPFSPCGAPMDWLRSCYSTDMAFYTGNPALRTRVHWYFCRETDPPPEFGPQPTPFGSANWDTDKWERGPLGEVPGRPRPWRNGSPDCLGEESAFWFANQNQRVCGPNSGFWQAGATAPLDSPPPRIPDTAVYECCVFIPPPVPPVLPCTAEVASGLPFNAEACVAGFNLQTVIDPWPFVGLAVWSVSLTLVFGTIQYDAGLGGLIASRTDAINPGPMTVGGGPALEDFYFERGEVRFWPFSTLGFHPCP